MIMGKKEKAILYYLDLIDDLLLDVSYGFAAMILQGIQKNIKQQQRITEKQIWIVEIIFNSKPEADTYKYYFSN